MVHESHVNDVSGIETDPNFIWMKYIEKKQTLVWFTIESNWLDDTTEIYANEIILKEEDFTVRKNQLRAFNNAEHGRLHSVHCFEAYEDHMFSSTSTPKNIILVYENSWIEMFSYPYNKHDHDNPLNFDSFELYDKSKLPIIDIREDLKFVFSQPPILKYA